MSADACRDCGASLSALNSWHWVRSPLVSDPAIRVCTACATKRAEAVIAGDEPILIDGIDPVDWLADVLADPG